jgi:hypothetical protein
MKGRLAVVFFSLAETDVIDGLGAGPADQRQQAGLSERSLFRFDQTPVSEGTL